MDRNSIEATEEQWAELKNDLASLSRTELRKKYLREATAHRNMKQRCRKSEKKGLDPRWEDFQAFIADVGPCPDTTYTLDRLNNENPNYGPGLAAWASKQDQTRNRKNTVWVLYGGRNITLAAFAKELGMTYQAAYAAWRRGQTPTQIVTRHRNKSGPTTIGNYWWLPSKVDSQKFDDAYKAWKSKKVRSGRRKLAHPEILFLIMSLPQLIELQETLTIKGEAHEWDDDAKALSARVAFGNETVKAVLESLSNKPMGYQSKPNLTSHQAIHKEMLAREKWLCASPTKRNFFDWG